ncbi:MAG: Dickkopf N-terminal cysteine-rich domain-containing protein, partial [Myxococcota bacterium]
EVLGGWCIAEPNGFGVVEFADLGEPCNEDDTDGVPDVLCRSRFCAPTPVGDYCSARCSADTDCGTGQLCIADVVALSDTRTVAWAICRNVPGSQRTCQRDADCSGTEVCNLYYRGQTTDDGRLSNPQTEGRCTTPAQPPDGITVSTVGGLCSGNRICDHEGMCFNAQNNPNPFCSAPCVTDLDCPGALVCAQGNIWDNNTPQNDGDDLVINICVPTGL